MTALSTDAALPLLGHASHDEFLDVCQRAAETAQHQQRAILASWATQMRRTDPVDLWSHGRTQTNRSLLWQSTWDRSFLVALGTAHDLTAHGDRRIAVTRESWQQLVQHAVSGGHTGDWLPTGAGPLLVGGFSFASGLSVDDTAGRESGTAPLPEALMWVPALQIRGCADTSTLAEMRVNAVVYPSDAPEDIAKSLIYLAERCLPERGARRVDNVYQGRAGQPLACQELPSAGTWKNLVGQAVDHIGRGAFEKVVLARELRVTAAEPFDLPVTLVRLRRDNPNSTVFAVEYGSRTFIGATPEYLARVSGRMVHALGLAGTVTRGASGELDAELENELTHSAKILHEHDIVVRMVADTLRPACAYVEAGNGPTVLKLANVQHLATVIEGRGVQPGLGLLQFVERLHPTPALGGHPRETSLEWLMRNEGLERGWYAGTIAWTDATGQGESAVAIRSALVREETASLYAGCGIVADSDPEAEYEESQAKLRPMLRALGFA